MKNKQKNDSTMKNDISSIVKPVQPSILTPLLLSFKSIKQNIFRFIFVTIFFSVSLIFATTTINLYYSNSSDQYSQFQQDYQNNFISLSQKSTLFDHTVQTSFFQIESSNHIKAITDISDEYKIYKTIKINFPINQNYNDTIPNYLVKSINNIIVIDELADITKYYNIIKILNTERSSLRCYITDMIAESLIECNYFGDLSERITSIKYDEYFSNKTLLLPGCKIPIYIEGIINTNYSSFKDKSFSDPNVFASYQDNLPFYNAIFMVQNTYVGNTNENQFISTNNINYTYDNFIYSSFGKNQIIENIKCTNFTNQEEMTILKGHEPLKPLTDQGMQQVAVSRGFYELYFDQPLDNAVFAEDGICGDGSSYINPSTSTQAVFSFYGYSRIMAHFGCRIVGIIDEDEPTLYFCNPEECGDFYNYLKVSFSDYDNTYQDSGGNLIIKITDDQKLNSSLYKYLIDRKLVINNLSFKKLQVVNEFIDNNLVLFLGLFFSLCLFSILMIFNFVVITIKNSTKDIGIYMSLGMNGFKISTIYLFQIILVSIISFIVSLIGSIIFLRLLDLSLSEKASTLILETYNIYLAPIDFDIFKLTMNGFLISFLIAFIAPILTICIPLINLSRKRPIDVIKLS